MAFLSVVAALLVLDATKLTPFNAARTWVFDTWQRQWPPDRRMSRTIVVEINDESIRRFGQWPWPRDLLANLLQALHGAEAIGLDLLLPEPDRLNPQDLVTRFRIQAPSARQALLALPPPDMTLAGAIRAQPTVLAMTIDRGDTPDEPISLTPVRQHGDFAAATLPQGSAGSLPIPVLAEAARGIGFVSAYPRTTGEIDRLPLVADASGMLVPGFAAELLRVSHDAGWITVHARFGIPTDLSVNGLTIHVDPFAELRPRFVGPARLTTLQAHQLLDPDQPPPALQGRIVIIGVTARGVGQMFPTPLGIPESSPALQAELIESVLAGDTLWRPFWAPAVERLLGLALGVTAGMLVRRIPYRALIIGLPITVLLLAGGSAFVFLRAGILLDWIFPACSLSLCALAGFVGRTAAEVAARRQHAAELVVERLRRTALEREMALRQEADSLRQSLAFAVDAASLGTWDADLRQENWHHSPRHDLILGLTTPPAQWSPDILLGRVEPQDRAAAVSSVTEAVTSGSLQMECGIRRPDGSLAYVSVLGRFWKDPDGKPTRVAGVIVDITKYREQELRLRQSEKMQAVGLLAGGVAHNFNNLLTVILGNLDLAAVRVDAASRTGVLLRNAIDAAQKSATIARQLLTFARRQPSNPRPVDTARLLNEIAAILHDMLPPAIRVELEIASNLRAIRIDPVDFELTLLNLAINARDAMPNGGHLRLQAFNQSACDKRLGLNGEFVVLEVKDDGEGMSAETRANVFEPFFTTKPIGSGTGLGLSQVHGFVHQAGGAVDIESALGRGTCIRLYLPVAEQQVRAAELRQKEVSS